MEREQGETRTAKHRNERRQGREIIRTGGGFRKLC